MSPNRKVIATFGRKRKPGYVKVFRETVRGASMVRVQWTQAGEIPGAPSRIKTESYPDNRKGLADAKAFAEGVSDGLAPNAKESDETPILPTTLRGLYEKYVAAKETEWADNTIRLSADRWGKFELFAGRNTVAGSVKRERLDAFKKALLVSGHVPNQVKHTLKEVVRVFAWGVENDVIPPTKLTLYSSFKFRKDVMLTAPKMAEYSAEERAQLIAVRDPRKPTEWRPWVADTIFAHCGPRIDATLRLEVDDIELAEPEFTLSPLGCHATFAGRMHWRAETNKTGEDWWQPLPAPVAEALWVALGWRQFDRYTGRFLFYGAQRRTRGQALRRDPRRSRRKSDLAGVSIDEKPWTKSAYYAALGSAERRAGIAHIKYRGAHAHRRGSAGDVHAATGSEKMAANWIGDRSVKVVRDRYLLKRTEELAKTAALPLVPNRNQTQQEVTEGVQDADKTPETSLTGEPAVGIEPTTARLRTEC